MAALSPTDVVDVLDADVATEKRAQWEAFEFTVLGDGDIEVVNDSHEDADGHTYNVHIEGGVPSNCTCPAFEFQPGACKHMVAVAIREPVLEAASRGRPIRADGGTATLDSFGADDLDNVPSATVMDSPTISPAGLACGTVGATCRVRANDPTVSGGGSERRTDRPHLRPV